MQTQIMTVNELYSKGWTIRQASRRIKRSYSHVAYVLRGERKSEKIQKALRALPKQDLVLRERVGK